MGKENWAAVKQAAADVIVEAVTAPRNTADEWAQIRWSGDTGKEVDGNQNRRRLSRAKSRVFHVQAAIGKTSSKVAVWILWARIEIKMKGPRPRNAARFDPGSRDETDYLGAVTYQSLISSVIDESKGEFVENMGASAKVAPVATLSPRNIHKIIKTGWAFEREVWTHAWSDGIATDATTNDWTRDTSKPEYLRLTPDGGDRIYDLDGPDIRWGIASYEIYHNFRQWIEWNGVMCSDYALWCWQARWRLHRKKSEQITLNDLRSGNVELPSKPYYPAAKSR